MSVSIDEIEEIAAGIGVPVEPEEDVIPVDASKEVVESESGVNQPVKAEVRSRSVQIHSKLGAQLYDLISKDVDGFYGKIRAAAFGESDDLPKDCRGKPARSAGAFLIAHRRMFLEIMKMVNSDIKVDRRDMKADLDVLLAAMQQGDTDQLQRLVEFAGNAKGS